MDELKKLRELTEALTKNGYLRDQAKVWEYALDAIPECIYIINNKLEIKFVNSILSERLKKSKEELYDKICYEEIQVYPQDLLVKMNVDSCSVFKPGKTLKDIFIKELEGWFNITISPIYSHSNQLLGFIHILKDISTEKKALEELICREATLDALFNATPIGIVLIEGSSGNRTLINVNKFLLDLLGYTKEELLSKSSRLYYLTDDEFIRVGALKYKQVKETGIGEIETQFVTKDGKIIDVFLKAVQVKNSDLFISTITDITEKKSKEKELESVLEFIQSNLIYDKHNDIGR